MTSKNAFTMTVRKPGKGFSGKVADLMFCSLGNGISVADKTREEHGDYKRLAHIDSNRVISWRKGLISTEQVEEIQRFAREEDPTVSVSQSDKVFYGKPPTKADEQTAM